MNWNYLLVILLISAKLIIDTWNFSNNLKCCVKYKTSELKIQNNNIILNNIII